MPIHDWTRVESGLFHHFHQDWTAEIARTLNRGVLPKGFSALIEQRVSGPEPDVVAVELGTKKGRSDDGGIALLEPPRLRLKQEIQSDSARYSRKANRISVRHHLGEVVAMIEVVSPGNKDSRAAFRSFVEKAVDFLESGVHLLIIDLFPPTPRDPDGVHKAILGEYGDLPFTPPAGKPLTLVSYRASPPITAHIEPLAVGDSLPDAPLYLTPERHVMVPLEKTYSDTWAGCPEAIRDLLITPEVE
ncbi:MAG: DUF4058 family protein [Gemmataceae bacterium]